MGKKKKKRIFSPFDDDEDDEDDENPFSNIFGDEGGFEGFEEIFKNIMKQFRGKDFLNFSRNIFKQMGLSAPGDVSNNKEQDKGKNRVDLKGPFVYGFSVRIGDDGKPIFEKFGDIRPAEPNSLEPDDDAGDVVNVREPIADVIEQEDEIIVVIELPGVEKENINIEATDYAVKITAYSNERHYQKNVELPAKINKDKNAKARYTNGILEIKLQKIGERETRSSTIPVD